MPYATLICSALVRLRAVIAVALVLVATPARAVDPAHAITQYAHRVWRIGDAGLNSPPYSIAQDHDGYIWLGAASGLYTFNGVNFEPWRDRSGSTPDLEGVTQLFVARDGSLYLGALGGLFHISDNHITRLHGSMEYPGPFVQDSHGRIWLPHVGGQNFGSSVCFVEGDNIRCLGKGDGLPCPNNQSIALDRQGALWIGGENGICRRDPSGHAQDVTPPALAHQHDVIALGLVATPSGELFAGLSVRGPGRGLMRWSNGRWVTLSEPGVNGAGLAVSSLWTDSRGSVWIGASGQGLYRYVNRRLDHFTVSDGLSDNEIFGGMEDREGSIWVVTARGVDQFRDLAVVPYSPREGLLGGGAYTVGASKDGSAWVSTSQAVYVIKNGIISKVRSRDSRFTNGYAALFGDSSGSMWIGSLQGGLRWDGGRFRPLHDTAGRPLPWVVTAAEDIHHDVWLANLERLGSGEIVHRSPVATLVRFHRGEPVEEIASPAEAGRHAIDPLAADPAGGLWLGIVKHGLFKLTPQNTFQRIRGIPQDALVSAIQPSGPGVAWVATTNGVFWVHGGQARPLTDLPCRSTFSVISDKLDNLWISLGCGLVRITPKERDLWLRDPRHRLASTVFGIESGYEGVLADPPIVAPDGKIWFSGADRVEVLDPSHLPFNATPPGISLSRVVADKRVYTDLRALRLPKLVRQIEIDYAGLSYVQPDHVKFYTRLMGHDRGWADVGARRQAFYNDLPPGKYRFQVAACNDDGVCAPRPAELPLMLPAAWWQTIWFKAIAIIAVAALIGFAIRIRMARYAESVRERFSERLQERTRVARELHDTLIQSVLASKLLADNARRLDNDPIQLKAALERLSGWLARAVDEGRVAVDVLRHSTVENGDLAEAIATTVQECQKSTPAEIFLHASGPQHEIYLLICDEIFHIASEAIRNACKHAKADHIWVEIDFGAALQVTIRDDGCGIEPRILKAGKAGHFGLLGMRERARKIGARLKVVSGNHGTEVSLRVPGSAIYQKRQTRPT